MGFSLDEYIKGKRKEQGERIATEPSAPRNDDLGQGMGKSTGGGFSLDAYMKEKSGGAKTRGILHKDRGGPVWNRPLHKHPQQRR